VQRGIPIGHHDPEFGEQTAQPIADRKVFGLVAFTHPMPRQPCLLVDVLDRHEAHVALARRRGDGLGVVGIVLGDGVLAERAHELGRDQARNESVFATTPRPVMRAAARFHRHHRARRQLREIRGERIAPELTPPQHSPDAIHLAHREYALCQVHTEGYSAHGDFLLC